MRPQIRQVRNPQHEASIHWHLQKSVHQRAGARERSPASIVYMQAETRAGVLLQRRVDNVLITLFLQELAQVESKHEPFNDGKGH
jgi:hypothetical protein